jgi:hypothetical protein
MFIGRRSVQQQELVINDSQATIDIEKILSQLVEPGSAIFKLDQILFHDELFQSYPELRSIAVKVTKTSGVNYKTGSWSPRWHRISLDYSAADEVIYSTLDLQQQLIASLLHEIQHVIQQIEAAPRGSNTHQWLNTVRAICLDDPKKLHHLTNCAKNVGDDVYLQRFSASVAYLEDMFRDQKTSKIPEIFQHYQYDDPIDFAVLQVAYALYFNDPGEMQARNVERLYHGASIITTDIDVRKLSHAPETAYFWDDKLSNLRLSMGRIRWQTRNAANSTMFRIHDVANQALRSLSPDHLLKRFYQHDQNGTFAAHQSFSGFLAEQKTRFSGMIDRLHQAAVQTTPTNAEVFQKWSQHHENSDTFFIASGTHQREQSKLRSTLAATGGVAMALVSAVASQISTAVPQMEPGKFNAIMAFVGDTLSSLGSVSLGSSGSISVATITALGVATAGAITLATHTLRNKVDWDAGVHQVASDETYLRNMAQSFPNDRIQQPQMKNWMLGAKNLISKRVVNVSAQSLLKARTAFGGQPPQDAIVTPPSLATQATHNVLEAMQAPEIKNDIYYGLSR